MLKIENLEPKERLRQYNRLYYQTHKDKFRGYRQKRLIYQRDWHRKNILFTNGKGYRVKKRSYPGICEMCEYNGSRLHYHHWDDNDMRKGIWVCPFCHTMIERYEQGFFGKYLSLKEKIENQFHHSK
jgi:hypothetical protein